MYTIYMITNSIWDKQYGVQGNALGYIIWELNNKIEIKMNSILSQYDITRFQYFILIGLYVSNKNKQTLTQDQLSTFINSNSMMVSKVLRQMEIAKLIERIENPKDSRSKLVSITTKGSKVYAQAQAKIQKIVPGIESNIKGKKSDFVDTLENLIKFLK
jgi:DNA-binding MarR family transcriptional regulator